MMGAKTPYYTKSYRSTSEKEMTSFVKSAKHSGFSAAEMGSMSFSSSVQGKANTIAAGGKASSKFFCAWKKVIIWVKASILT